MNITNDIRYIGVNDHKVDLFEGQYVVPNGMAYNSYVIMDEKIAVMDTVDDKKWDWGIVENNYQYTSNKTIKEIVPIANIEDDIAIAKFVSAVSKVKKQ